MYSCVDTFLDTPAGPVPRVRTRRGPGDWAGTALARLGITRDNYAVSPGLYAVGTPDAASPVIVTANYKLTFDVVREDLAGQHVWLLVLDTRGINVWCAAGKNLFSTDEVVRRIRSAGLEKVVSHRRVVLPQLGAPGVSAREVRRATGFSVVYGPVRSADLPDFLAAGQKAAGAMRMVEFPLRERAVLIPVELVLLWKTLLLAFGAVFVLSGIGPHVFSFTEAVTRLGGFAWATLFGVLAGHVGVPLLLPRIPFRAFAAKGAVAGACVLPLLVFVAWARVAGFGGKDVMEWIALGLWTVTISSFLAMNFSGSTPYTSPSGVEWEMRRAVPLQVLAVAVCAFLWVFAAFV